MIKGYDLPPDLGEEIDQLEALIQKYKRGEISLTELKAYRVPFGVYEQRESGTYMVRIRCVAGFITPEQLEKVSAIALQYGVGDIHITTRQELQIHYVKLNDIAAIIRRLKDIGLSTRGGGGNTVRNITAQETAGIDPDEEFDVSLYASALTTRLIAESDSWNLPRKFKIAFSGSVQDKGYATISDIGFIAKVKGGKKGFRVYTAGGLGAKSAVGNLLIDFIEADEVYAITKALKTIFFKYGNRRNKHAARMRFLWQSLGEEEFKKRFNEEYAKIKADSFKPLVIDETQAVAISTAIPTYEVELAKPDLNLVGWNDAFSLWKQRFVKPQKQKGLYSILIPVELGFVSCQSAAALAKFLEPFGSDTLRMTKDQNFLLRNIHGDYLATAYNFLKKTIPGTDKPAIFGRILSCAGASTCQLGICLSRQAAKAIIKELEISGLDLEKMSDIKINISGCPNSCGQHSAADLGFFGKASRKGGALYPAYNVVYGAVIRDGETKLAEQIGEAPAKALPLLVRDYIKGESGIKDIVLKYSEAPVFDEDKSYYFDWGSDKQFSLAERKAGECSAGFFDLLEMDLNNIKKPQTAKDLVFFSSRALLITRGVDAKNEDDVYESFLKNFIEAGLIDSRFKDIVVAARNKDLKVTQDRDPEARDLANAVLALYETMDNNFNFAKPQPKPLSVIDLRGVACPMNFVRTKIGLSQLKSEEVMEVWLDDGEPMENVPGSVRDEGHTILEQKKVGNYWSVVIKKK